MSNTVGGRSVNFLICIYHLRSLQNTSRQLMIQGFKIHWMSAGWHVWPSPVPLRPVPLRPVPLRPVPLRPVPLRPVPLRPVPLRLTESRRRRVRCR